MSIVVDVMTEHHCKPVQRRDLLGSVKSSRGRRARRARSRRLSCEQTTAQQQQDKPNLKRQQVVDRDRVFARLLVPSVTRRHFPHYCPLHPGVAIMSAAVTSATCGPGAGDTSALQLFTALPALSL